MLNALRNRRWLGVALLAALLAACLVPALAGHALAAEGGIAGKVKGYSSESFAGEVDALAGRVVGFVRGIAGVAAVLFLIWFGFTLFGAGDDPHKKAAAKSRFVYFLLALILVMGAERIVGLILSLLGWGTS